MSEKTKPEAIPEELTKEQLEGVSGGTMPSLNGFVPVAASPQPTKATGSDSSNPGFTSDQFTIGSSGLG